MDHKIGGGDQNVDEKIVDAVNTGGPGHVSNRGCSTPGGPRGVRTALYWFGSHA